MGTPYVPKIGETYRWLAYEYASLILSCLCWVSFVLFPHRTPWIIFALPQACFILTFAAAIIVVTFSIFGIKNGETSQRRRFFYSLLLSLPGPFGLLGFIFVEIRLL